MKRFYGAIPALSKLRRVKGSPSFIRKELARFSVSKDGKKVLLTARVEGKTKNDFRISFKNSKGEEVACFVGSVIDLPNGKKMFNLFHRIVRGDFRGYNIGKTGFRLFEQQAKKMGANYLFCRPLHKDVVTTALSLGWKVTKETEGEFKSILGIDPDTALPNRKDLLDTLKRPRIRPDMYFVKLEKKLD